MAHPVTLFLGPIYLHLLLSYMSPQSLRLGENSVIGQLC